MANYNCKPCCWLNSSHSVFSVVSANAFQWYWEGSWNECLSITFFFFRKWSVITIKNNVMRNEFDIWPCDYVTELPVGKLWNNLGNKKLGACFCFVFCLFCFVCWVSLCAFICYCKFWKIYICRKEYEQPQEKQFKKRNKIEKVTVVALCIVHYTGSIFKHPVPDVSPFFLL